MAAQAEGLEVVEGVFPTLPLLPNVVNLPIPSFVNQLPAVPALEVVPDQNLHSESLPRLPSIPSLVRGRPCGPRLGLPGSMELEPRGHAYASGCRTSPGGPMTSFNSLAFTMSL